MTNEANNNCGHRRRIKDKFLKDRLAENFLDYEVLELALFYAIPRRDVKPLAKNLMEKFKKISELINADKDKVLSVTGPNDSVYILLKLMREITKRSLKEEIAKKNVISSWTALINYLRFAMSFKNVEQLRVLFLNKSNELIADEVLSNGTIDQTLIYPREVVKKSLYYSASAIILVHNHPSGSSRPSKSDIEMTRSVIAVCKAVDIEVHDHIIICKSDFYSFKKNLLI